MALGTQLTQANNQNNLALSNANNGTGVPGITPSQMGQTTFITPGTYGAESQFAPGTNIQTQGAITLASSGATRPSGVDPNASYWYQQVGLDGTPNGQWNWGYGTPQGPNGSAIQTTTTGKASSQQLPPILGNPGDNGGSGGGNGLPKLLPNGQFGPSWWDGFTYDSAGNPARNAVDSDTSGGNPPPGINAHGTTIPPGTVTPIGGIPSTRTLGGAPRGSNTNFNNLSPADQKSLTDYLTSIGVPNAASFLQQNNFPVNPSTPTTTKDPTGQFAISSTQDPNLTNEFNQWLQSQVGQGAPAFPGQLSANTNPLITQLQNAFTTGDFSQVPWLASLMQSSQGSSPTAVPDILKQLADPASNGLPVDQTPQWQAAVDAEQRNIAENAANLKGQFAFNGGLNGSPFGQSISDFYSQTSKDQNANLTAEQAAALEAGRARQVTAGQDILASSQQDKTNSLNSSQFLGNAANTQAQEFQALNQADQDRLVNEFIRTSPQYSPLISAEQSAAQTYPPLSRITTGLGLSGLLGALIPLLGLKPTASTGTTPTVGSGPTLGGSPRTNPGPGLPGGHKPPNVNTNITPPANLTNAFPGLPLSQWQTFLGRIPPGLASVFSDPNFDWTSLTVADKNQLEQVISSISYGDTANPTDINNLEQDLGKAGEDDPSFDWNAFATDVGGNWLGDPTGGGGGGAFTPPNWFDFPDYGDQGGDGPGA